MCGLEQLQSVVHSGSCVALCSASTGTANWRPKMSWVVCEFLPIFWRVSCRLVISASICLIRSAGSVAAMVVGRVAGGMRRSESLGVRLRGILA